MTSRPAAPAGAVLTGGASSRMGRDKALLAVHGQPMAARVAGALTAAGCRPVWCQGGDPALGTVGLDVVADERPGGGPVAAILSALRHAPGDVVVAACDLVDLDARSVRAVAAATPPGAVAVAVAGGRRHLLSRWPAAAEPLLASSLAVGVRSYRDAIDALAGELGVVEVEVPEAAVRNVNTPGDL